MGLTGIKAGLGMGTGNCPNFPPPARKVVKDTKRPGVSLNSAPSGEGDAQLNPPSPTHLGASEDAAPAGQSQYQHQNDASPAPSS